MQWVSVLNEMSGITMMVTFQTSPASPYCRRRNERRHRTVPGHDDERSRLADEYKTRRQGQITSQEEETEPVRKGDRGTDTRRLRQVRGMSDRQERPVSSEHRCTACSRPLHLSRLVRGSTVDLPRLVRMFIPIQCGYVS